MTNEEIPNLTAFDAASLDEAFGALERQARGDADALNGEAAVEPYRLHWLGRKQGRLNEVSGRWLKAAPPEDKKALGLRFNKLKELVELLLEQGAGAGPSDAALAAEAIDITLSGTRRLTGAEHPITKTLNEITQVFAALGYSVGVGPEVETDFYNFECMNFPPGHPARDTQDTLVGAEHPITRTLNEIVGVFAALGYSVGVGPEVETDYYNFESMNFPPGHPARD